MHVLSNDTSWTPLSTIVRVCPCFIRSSRRVRSVQGLDRAWTGHQTKFHSSSSSSSSSSSISFSALCKLSSSSSSCIGISIIIRSSSTIRSKRTFILQRLSVLARPNAANGHSKITCIALPPYHLEASPLQTFTTCRPNTIPVFTSNSSVLPTLCASPRHPIPINSTSPLYPHPPSTAHPPEISCHLKPPSALATSGALLIVHYSYPPP